MPTYIYTARNVEGKIIRSEIIANTEKEAREKVITQRLLPHIINITEKRTNAEIAASRRIPTGTINQKDLTIFTRQLSTLMNAGIPVVDALDKLGKGKRPLPLKEAIQGIKTAIEQGASMSTALKSFPNIFDKFYCNMVMAGEQAGILDGVLVRMTASMEKSMKLRRQIKGALTYPIVIIFVAIVVVVGLLVFIVPRFQEIFAKSGQELPALTTFIVDLSHFMTQKWYLLVLVFAVGPYLLYMFSKTESGKATLDRVFLKIPLFGDLILKGSTARFTRTLSTLLTAGVGIIEALEIAAATSGNTVVEETILRVKESVIQGKSFAKPLADTPLIPELVSDMVAIGEATGHLDVMLGKVADFFEEEVDVVVSAMSSIIEPMLMIVLGSIIAFVVVALYLPIMNMANTVGGG